jgi:hypothetical protein
MNLAEFRDWVDSHGSDMSNWPAGQRLAAERLLAADAGAREWLAEAQRLDSLIAGAMTGDMRATEASVARVLGALRPPLPPQRRSLLARIWPAALLDVDLAPARWRIAALAGVACLGVGLGLWGPDIGSSDGGFAVASASADGNLAQVFEPEALTGLTP